MTSRLSAPSALVLAVALAACGGDPGTAIDPDAADERLFQEGLALYGQLMFAPAAAKFDELVAAYPASPRHDNAGYLAGRCAYELADYAGAIADLTAMRAAHADSLFLDEAAYYTGRARFRTLDYLGSEADFRASIAEGPLEDFTCFADPVSVGITGRRFFRVDGSGIVRYNSTGRPAADAPGLNSGE